MNTAGKMIIVLTFIATLSGAILSLWDGYTAPMIDKHRLDELVEAIADVLPDHDNYQEIKSGETTLFIANKVNQSEPVGIAFRAVGSGFQGKISVMVGVEPDFKTITGIKVLEQIETPGLGTKIVEDPSNKTDHFWFPKQFRGVDIQHEIVVLKNEIPSKENEVQAISGATITSKALVRLLNESIRTARTIYNKEG